MKFLHLTLLLLVSCGGKDEPEVSTFPWRLEQGVKNAAAVEALWLGKPEKASVGVVGRAILQRTKLDDRQATFAKEVVLALAPYRDIGPHPGVVDPKKMCYPDFGFVFRVPGNAIVAAFDTCFACKIEGMGQFWKAQYIPNERLAQLVSEAFPDHPRNVQRVVNQPVHEGFLRDD